MGITQVTRDIPNKVILLTRLAPKDQPEAVSLDIVLISDRKLLGKHGANPLLVLLARLDRPVLKPAEGGGVVRVCAVVAAHVHVAVAVEGAEGGEGAVDGDLEVVSAEAVAVGVRVGEEAGLQDRVGGGLDAGDHVRGGEGSLFDFSEVVLRVRGEGESAEAAERDVALRPDFGQVEDVPAEVLGLRGAEGLDVAGPGGVLAAGDGVEEVLGVPVWVVGGELGGFFVGEGFAALVSFAVDLDVVEGAVGLDPFVGVTGVAVHVAVGVRGAAVAEEVHELVDGLLVGGEVVPEHGGVLQVGLGVPLLGVDEHWELGRVTEEEDGGVVEDPVPVALRGIELEGKPSGIASTIGRALLTTDSGETSEHVSLLADTLEHVDGSLVSLVTPQDVDGAEPAYNIADIVGDLKLAVRTGTLGMNHTLWDPLPVEVCQ